MAFIIPLGVAATGALYATAVALDWKRQTQTAVENASQMSEEKEPFQGAIGHFRSRTGADNLRFVSVSEDYDVQGAKQFLVDYGNGQRVVQYHDPRIYW